MQSEGEEDASLFWAYLSMCNKIRFLLLGRYVERDLDWGVCLAVWNWRFVVPSFSYPEELSW